MRHVRDPVALLILLSSVLSIGSILTTASEAAAVTEDTVDSELSQLFQNEVDPFEHDETALISDEDGVVTDKDIAETNLTETVRRLRTTLRANYAGICPGVKEMKQFDQMTQGARNALYHQNKRRGTYYCMKDADQNPNLFGIPKSTFTVSESRSLFNRLPASFNAEKVAVARGQTCTVMNVNQYAAFTNTYVQTLRKIAKHGAASKLEKYMELLWSNKFHIFRISGRPQMGSETNMCLDEIYVPIITEYVFKHLQDARASRGQRFVEQRLGITARMAEHQLKIAGRSDDEIAMEVDRTLGNLTAHAELASLPYSARQDHAIFSRCHPICNTALMSMSRSMKTKSLKTCCAQCRGSWCRPSLTFTRLMRYSAVVSVTKVSPFPLATVDLSWV